MKKIQSKAFTRKDSDPSGWLEGEGNLNLKSIDLAINTLLPDNGKTSFSETVTIPASSELTIDNKLSVVPDEWAVIDLRENTYPLRGDTTWTRDFLYLKNPDAGAQLVAKIRFSYTRRD